MYESGIFFICGINSLFNNLLAFDPRIVVTPPSPTLPKVYLHSKVGVGSTDNLQPVKRQLPFSPSPHYNTTTTSSRRRRLPPSLLPISITSRSPPSTTNSFS